MAKGFRLHRGHTIKAAKEGIMHALSHAYRDRRTKKRNARKLWIIRLNAALRQHGLTYSRFINMLKEKNVELDRKVLSKIAVHDGDVFGKIVEKIRE